MHIPLLRASLAAVALATLVSPVAAAEPADVFTPVPITAPGTTSTPWLWAAGVATGLATLSLLDEDVQSFLQDSRSSGLDEAAGVFGPVGGAEVYLPVASGVLLTGLVAGDSEITAAGGRISASLALAGVLTRGLKYATGRDRPSAGLGNGSFEPFTTRTSFPSGHTAMAFALASSASYEINRPWATVSLHVLAGLAGWSRLNDNVHWVTDVAAGAVLGQLTSRWIQSRLGENRASRQPALAPMIQQESLGLSLTLGL